MPLKTLSIDNCPGVRDLAPLAGLPLTSLTFSPRYVTNGIDVIRNMTSIEQIAPAYHWRQPRDPVTFWKRYDDGEFEKATAGTR